MATGHGRRWVVTFWRAVKRDRWVLIIAVVVGALSATSFCSGVHGGGSSAAAMQCHSWAGTVTRPIGSVIGAAALVQLRGGGWGLLLGLVIIAIRNFWRNRTRAVPPRPD